MIGVPVNSIASASFSTEKDEHVLEVSVLLAGLCPPVEVCKQGPIIWSLWQAVWGEGIS